MFDRKDMTTDERFEDLECIAGLTLDPKHPFDKEMCYNKKPSIVALQT